MKKYFKQFTMHLGILLPICYYLFVIKDYHCHYVYEPIVIGFMVPLCTDMIMWGKDGYKNEK